MKSLLSLLGMVMLAVLPANAGVHGFVSFGGGSFHGTFSTGGFSNGGRCGYSASCYGSYRPCGYSYPCYGGYGYYYGGYAPYIYTTGYDVSYAPTYEAIPVPAPQPQPQPPAPAATTPAPASTPAPAPMEFGILDVNGFIHSPYSDAVFKVPGVRNAQMVYDPVTGKPFLVR